jgi:hypothetical protein
MNRALLSVLALAAAAGIANADVITQSFTYDWDSSQPQHAFSFQAFDAMGGMRQLTAVRLGFDGTISMEIRAHTYDPAPVHTGEWSVEASHTVVAYFNGGGIDLLQGIGGQSRADITGELGGGINGEPGTPLIVTDTVNLVNTVEIDPSHLPEFYGSGQFTGFMDGFFDAVVTPPNSGQWIEVMASLLSQEGAVTLTYEYATVPAPAATAALGMGLLAGLRRRR